MKCKTWCEDDRSRTRAGVILKGDVRRASKHEANMMKPGAPAAKQAAVKARSQESWARNKEPKVK